MPATQYTTLPKLKEFLAISKPEVLDKSAIPEKVFYSTSFKKADFLEFIVKNGLFEWFSKSPFVCQKYIDDVTACKEKIDEGKKEKTKAAAVSDTVSVADSAPKTPPRTASRPSPASRSSSSKAATESDTESVSKPAPKAVVMWTVPRIVHVLRTQGMDISENADKIELFTLLKKNGDKKFARSFIDSNNISEELKREFDEFRVSSVSSNWPRIFLVLGLIAFVSVLATAEPSNAIGGPSDAVDVYEPATPKRVITMSDLVDMVLSLPDPFMIAARFLRDIILSME
nr:hypothetical protein TetV2_00476 [Oceanusvirus sp.]